MELRKEIEAKFDIAEKSYPEILKLIMEYTDYCDENGDEDNSEYEKLENKLHGMTGKDMSQFNLWEWWEEDGAENLAFNISLPEPEIVDNITKEELNEIVKRLKTYEEPDEDDKSFKVQFYNYMCFGGNDYYKKFIELNFNTYQDELFERKKDKTGNYYEYTLDEIVERLWNNGNYK